MTSDTNPEFSRVVKVSLIEADSAGMTVQHEADEGEREALTRRFDLMGLPAFGFTAELKHTRTGNGFRLTGHIAADVIQCCVVTLEPVTEHFDEDFEILLFDEGDQPDEAANIEEEYETFSNDLIDLGEIAAVELALSLNPYPRNADAESDMIGPGAVSGESRNGDNPDQDQKNPTYRPFAGLAALRRNR
jgi:uncharacterized metal-binding protein YceD (DUF177 family)